MEFDQIEGIERDWLERRFEKEEILQIVKELERDKALGPDGFTMAFYHHCWGVVEREGLAIFEEFYQHSKANPYMYIYSPILCLVEWVSG